VKHGHNTDYEMYKDTIVVVAEAVKLNFQKNGLVLNLVNIDTEVSLINSKAKHINNYVFRVCKDECDNDIND
jgi:hypothetical protein